MGHLPFSTYWSILKTPDNFPNQEKPSLTRIFSNYYPPLPMVILKPQEKKCAKPHLKAVECCVFTSVNTWVETSLEAKFRRHKI
jgi:hypothetical protein